MKTIALVEWSWGGHHASYFRQMLLTLNALGLDILPVCPVAGHDEVNILREKLSGDCKIHEPLVARSPNRRRFVPKVLRGLAQAVVCYSRLGNQLRRWEKKAGRNIDLVFFTCIYDQQFSHFCYVQFLFRYRWSGLYLHARSLRLPGSPMPYSDLLPCPEKIFNSSGMSSVCLLDEGVMDEMSKITSGKTVIQFPDFTDVRLQECEYSLAKKLKAFAGERKIVVCLGHLQKTKGIYELCLAARHPSLSDTIFFFGGEVLWAGISAAEKMLICDTWEQAPNVLTHLARIGEDAAINELISVSDLVFAAYTNFPNSSNMLTKAAYFEKPILVSDGFLMAERVREYGLGSIVPEGSVSDIIENIVKMCANDNTSQAEYKRYYECHSTDKLKSALASVVKTET